MANCHNLFKEFNEQITLTTDRKKNLIDSKNSLVKKIKNYIKDNKPNENQPLSYLQGSVSMGTAVNPIPKENKFEYDLDNGIYFLTTVDERKDVSTYHKWIYDAVKTHTNDVIDKDTCVRAIYSDGHHIDLPIYFMDKSNPKIIPFIPLLAHKRNGWVESDPRAFRDWVKAKKNDQIIRLIKYIKAWGDYNQENYTRLSGIIFTILIIDHYSINDRDDISFLNTVKSIYQKLNLFFSCLRPTPDRNENLLDRYSNTEKDSFLKGLKKLIDDGEKAINQSNQMNACEFWQNQFGSRFSCSNAKDELENAQSFPSPPIIKTSSKSA